MNSDGGRHEIEAAKQRLAAAKNFEHFIEHVFRIEKTGEYVVLILNWREG